MLKSLIHSDYQIPEITRKLTLDEKADADTSAHVE